MKATCLAWGLLILVWGCRSGSEGELEESGIDMKKNPLGALSEFAKATKQIQEKAEKMAKQEPVDPVPYQELIALLPEREGWEAKDEPEGKSSQMGEYQVSQASRSFAVGLGKERKTMKVEIIDGSYVPMVYAPFELASRFQQESTSGYHKGLKIGGHPGFVEWKSKDKRVQLSLLVADRFLVTINGRNVEEGEGQKWAEAVDIQRLEALAKQGAKAKADDPEGAKTAPPAETGPSKGE